MPVRYVPPDSWRQVPLGDLLVEAGRSVASSGKATASDKMPVYLAGDGALLKSRSVSLIGSRKVSKAGVDRAIGLAEGLVGEGIVVMSGLAEGVDTAAMAAAIKAQGRTVGVIGTPLDKAYPAANARLQEQVYREHLLVSQFAHRTAVRPGNFPMRNKLMSALSDGTVIVEAADGSGTLHQATECVRLNRWLFITRSLVEDPKLTWPSKFTSYDRCVALDSVSQILERVRP